ncbi:MAG: PolC-type DNA polymerase III [Erysipelotrichaceae bacterium]
MIKAFSKIDLNKKTLMELEESELIDKVLFDKINKSVTFNIQVKRVLSFDCYLDLLNKLKDTLKLEVILVISAADQVLNKNFEAYFNYFLRNLGINNIDYFVIDLGNSYSIQVYQESDVIKLNDNKFQLTELLQTIGSNDSFNIELKLPEQKIRKVIKKAKSLKVNPKNFKEIKLADVENELANVMLSGFIFDIDDERITKKGNNLTSFNIVDEKVVMPATVFSDNDKPKFSLSNNSFCRLYGDIRYNTFNQGLVFYPREIENIDNDLIIKDEENNTRVELHSHTTYSEMDGVSSTEELINTAYQMGLSGIAITDHMAIQAFPTAQMVHNKIIKNNPETNFKLIYGVEFNMVEDKLDNLINYSKNMELANLDYIVFDLETTGLSAVNDEIIEFGAIKVRAGTVVDSLQIFIKPQNPISDFISSMTGITNEMVSSANSFEQEVQRIIDFIGNDTLVAHNASFDFHFLNQALANIHKTELNNNMIDTLALAKNLLTDRKYFSLGRVAKSLGVHYDTDAAHRADYDCEVLNGVFISLLQQLSDLNITTIDDLNDFSSEDFYSRAFKTHVTALVRNAEGLKDLYELVSLSNIKYMAVSKSGEGTEPRLLRKELNALRANLFIGSSCQNNELIDLAINARDSQLAHAIDFYDYIEIQPLWAYQPLLDKGVVKSQSLLIKALKRLIKAAQKQGKIIVATSDNHYTFKHQKIFRDIMISAPGIGGVRHPLYYFNQELREKTTSPDSYLYTTEKMRSGYSYLDSDFVEEIVVKNTNLLASKIERVYPIKDKLYPPKIEGDADKLRNIAYTNARKQYGNPLPTIVEQRLEKELSSIIGHGFQVVYYISHLLVKKSLDDGYLVGSRGSVGSSLVATMSEITEVNPLVPHYYCPDCQYSEFFDDGIEKSGFDLPDKNCPHCHSKLIGDGQDIPFETFLGFNGDKVPDIDLNFSSLYQERAHEYTKVIFGAENLYRAGTISTVAHKTAYGYVLGYYESQNLAIPPTRTTQRLYLNYLASNVEGTKRTTGQHPGGIIVVPEDYSVYDFTPVQYPANDINANWKTTHFAFADIHDNLLKLDLLGHVDPTAMYILQKNSGIDSTKLPMNDAKVLSLFNSTEALNIDDPHYNQKTGALGLPEFGTDFVRRILEATRPTTFEELVIISGISHGTGNWRDNADKIIADDVATLKEVIGCRDDIMLYLIKQGLDSKMAFDIMEAVRKGKGISSEWEKAMKEHGVQDWYLESAKKIAYLFPKAHAVAYTLMCIRVAWFKVYAPAYYYACFFSIRCSVYDIVTMIKGKNEIFNKVTDIKERLDDDILKRDVSNKDKGLVNVLEVAYEMYCRGYYFTNISIEKSQATDFIFNPDNEMEIIPPFTSLDGLGESVANKIVEARLDKEFISIKDLKDRGGVNGTIIKNLSDLGCIEHLPEDNQLSLFSL